MLMWGTGLGDGLATALTVSASKVNTDDLYEQHEKNMSAKTNAKADGNITYHLHRETTIRVTTVAIQPHQWPSLSAHRERREKFQCLLS